MRIPGKLKALNLKDGFAIKLILRLLGENFQLYRKRYAFAFVLMWVVSVTTAGTAWIMKDIVNEIFVERDSSMVLPIALTVLAIYVVKGISNYGVSITLTRIGNNIVARSQKRLYDHLLTQGVDFFGKHPTSGLVTRLSHNAQAAREVLNTLVMSLGRDLLSLIGLIAVMVIQDPVMSLVALIVMPLAIIGVGRLVTKARRIAHQEFLSLARIIAHTQETSFGIRIVKAFNMEDRMRAATHSAINAVEYKANKIAGLTARTTPLMETLVGFGVALVISYGGYRVIEHGRDPGSFFSFLTAMLMAYEPARRLARLNVNLQTGLIGVKMMYDLLDTPSTLTQLPDAPELKMSGGHIRLSGVTFGYNSAPVLRDISLEAKTGQLTALVGPSGAGKTTTFALIERFWDPWEGTVKIDDQSVESVSLHSLRTNIALVTQDVFLFDGTVSENIAIGRPDAGQEEVVNAAKAANAHEFIMEMPEGYEAPVGESGGRLSSGERQRIAIARAMLRDAPILLLDEATSALDAESESRVQEAFDRLMKGRTTVVIAHRLATVRNADVIYVMDHGSVIEHGSHLQLMESGGLYRNLYSLQFADSQNHATSSN